jgi:hypothetical protein
LTITEFYLKVPFDILSMTVKQAMILYYYKKREEGRGNR